ncbi:MAG: hypothetical protein AAGI25_05140 [Bacteroidota bacterium]
MYWKSISIVTLVALGTLPFNLKAQSTASKTFTENLLIESEDIIQIIGEKANVSVTESNTDQLELKVTFKATNNNKSLAVKELEYLRYGLFRENNRVQIRNSFMLPSNVDHIESTLEVLYELALPPDRKVEITNKYGYIEIIDFKGTLDINLKFCDLLLDHVTGIATLKTSFSEVHGRNVGFSSMESEDDKSRVLMNITSGSYRFKSTYGDLILSFDNVQDLHVQSKRTDVVLIPKTFEQFGYDMLSDGGSIYVPDKYIQLLKKEGKKVLFLMKKPSKPTIKISTDYNTITLN